MPAFHGRRIHQRLAHGRGRHRQVQQAGLGETVRAGELHGADHQFHGAFHLAEARRLERLRVEQHAQHGAQVAARLEVGLLQRLDARRVLRRHVVPRRHLRLVGHEEVVQVAGDEARRGGLLDDDAHDVVAVEVAGLAQEGLLAVVVVVRAEDERRGVAAVRIQRNGLRGGPAGEGARRVLDVLLAVVADAHGKQFEDFAAVVLVRGVFVILGVVQPVQHAGVAGQVEQDGFHVGQAIAAEGLDLQRDAGGVLALVPAGSEDAVPEEGHFFLQRALGVDHAIEPAPLPQHRGIVHDGSHGVVAAHHVFLDVGGLLRVQQHLHHVGVVHAVIRLQLGARGAESGAPQQVRQECESVVSHASLLTVKARPPPGGVRVRGAGEGSWRFEGEIEPAKYSGTPMPCTDGGALPFRPRLWYNIAL